MLELRAANKFWW